MQLEKPVTVKMRIGWDEDHIFAVENAQSCRACWWTSGCCSWRTRVQMYEGKANWDIIREVKASC